MSLKRSIHTSKQPKQDFSWACCIHEVLDNIELKSNVTIHIMLMTEFRDLCQNLQKWSHNEDFRYL